MAAMLAFSMAVVFSALSVIADIPDGVVYTDVRKIVIEGDNAVLKCQFRGTPLAVYWKKGSDPRSAPNLITWVKDLPPAGSCVEGGSCEMTDDFSLILKEVEMEDQGRYICQVANYVGNLIHNFTDVKVIDLDQLSIHTEPYVIGRAGSSVNLPCNFTIEPTKVLWERVYWNGGRKVETILRYTSDGYEEPAFRRYNWIENYGMIIRDLHVSDEGIFTCLVSTTDGIEIKNSTILVLIVSETQSTTSSSTTIVVVVIIFLVVPVFIIFVMIRIRQYKSFTKSDTGTGFRSVHQQTMIWDCFRWVFCCKDQDSCYVGIEVTPERQLDNLRKQLKEYWPGTATGSENTERFPGVISLGVFGLTGAGKSSLINSLKFALNNKFEDVFVSGVSDGGETKFSDPILLTKHISVCYRTLEDLSVEQIGDSLMSQIRALTSRPKVMTETGPSVFSGAIETQTKTSIKLEVHSSRDEPAKRSHQGGERGRNRDEEITNREVIHCPIFVHDIRAPARPMLAFLKEFSGLVCYEYGRHVMVVVTHKEEDEDSFEPFEDKLQSLGVPEEQIWRFENYTKTHKNHNVEKSISYLKFLQMCLKIGEKNLQFVKRK